MTIKTLTKIASDKDLHFTGEITAGNMETENLSMPADFVTIGVDKILITELVLEASRQLEYDVVLWPTDKFDETDLDLDKAIGYINFPASDGKQIAGANQYRYLSGKLEMYYRDDDQTSEIHIGVVNRTQTTKTNSDTVKLIFSAIPIV